MFNVNQVKKVEIGVITIERGINKILLIGNNKEIRIGLIIKVRFPLPIKQKQGNI